MKKVMKSLYVHKSNVVELGEKYVKIVEERKNLVEEMKKLADLVVITVRADKKSIKSTWIPYNDGYMTPKNTFQKIYDEKSLKEEFGDVEILYKDAMGITFIAK